MRSRRVLLVIIAALLFTITTPFVAAQSPEPSESTSSAQTTAPQSSPATGVNLTVSPVFVSLTTDPGEAVTTEIRVTNNNNFTENLRMDVQKFTSGQNGETPIIQEMGPQDEFANWISFSEDTFAVAANQTKTIKVTLSPPKEAALGYYYAIVVNRARLENGEKVPAVVGAPAIPLLLNVRSPNAKQELQLVDFKTDKFFYEYLPVTFQVKVKNTGNIHLAPSGDIFIDSATNKNVADLRANEGRGNVLPGFMRTYTTDWNDGFLAGVPKKEGNSIVRDKNGTIQYKTEWNFAKADKFRFGKYTAHLIVVYNNGQRDVPIEATVSFWVIPWKILAVAMIILIFVLLGIKNTISSTVGRFKK